VLGKPIEREYSLMDLLRRPGVSYTSRLSFRKAARSSAMRSRSQVRFKPNTKAMSSAQHEEIARQERYGNMALPRDLDYRSVRACRSKCSRN